MKPQRLWPLLLAMAMLLGGALGLEVVAARHVVTAEVIEIARNDDELDEDEETEAQRWYTLTPLDDDHRRARLLAHRGEYEPALALLEKLRSVHADNVMLLAEHGHWLRKAGQPEQALALLEQAQARLPEDPTIALDRGLAMVKLGRAEDAIAAYRLALALRPSHTPTRIALGALLRRRGRLDEALAVLEPASKTGSNEERARALAALGRTQAERGEFQAARRTLREAVQRAPSSASIWSRAASTLAQSDDPELLQAAIEHALAARALAPQSGAIQRLIGRTYEKFGKTAEALDAYQRAVSLDGHDEYARKRLLRLCLERDDHKGARRQADALLELQPERPESHFLAGLVDYRAGALDAARTHYQNAIGLSHGAYPEALYNLGLLERRAGDGEAAIRAYRAAIAAKPDYREAWNNLGLVLQDGGAFADAVAAFQQAIALDDGYLSARMNLGQCFSAQGLHERAIAEFREVLEREPKHRRARLQLAVSYRKTGQSERAVAVYRELVRDEPRYVRAWYNLGVALGTLERNDEARAAYRRALQYDPQHLASLKNLGLLESRAGRRSDAQQLLAEALERAPADDEVRMRLAELHFAQGDLAHCSDEARRVLSQGTRVGEARALLAKCTSTPGRARDAE